MLKVNLPSLKLNSFHQNKFGEVNLNPESRNNRWTVLFFYPADFTFVCPTELEDLAKQTTILSDLGVDVFGVSTDTHFVHKAWFDASETIKKINYPLLSDSSHELSKSLMVLDEKTGLAERATFVFDSQGQLVLFEATMDGVGRNAEELVRKIKAAQWVVSHPGEACPAKWEEGQKTLKPSLDLVGKI